MINTNLTLPVYSKLWIETSFKFPKIGNFIHKISLMHWAKNFYANMALKVVGAKDLLQANSLVLDDDVIRVAKDLRNLRNIFAIVLEGISDSTDNENLREIRESAVIIINSVDEIIELIEKRKYEKLKKDMFVVSSRATLANLRKYNEPIYES